MKSIYKFLLMVFLFLAFVLFSDRIAYKLALNLFLNSPDELRYAYNDCDDDIVILGSSRAKHYNTDLLADSLGDSLKCFSYGSSGQNIYYHYAVLNTILEKNKPKVVICDLMDIDVKKTSDLYSTAKLSRLYPLYNLNDTVKSVIQLQGNNAKTALFCSQLYHFNSKIPAYIFEIVEGSKKYADFKGLEGIYEGEIQHVKVDSIRYDNLKLEYIQRLIDVCEKNNVKLILVISPIFEFYENGASPLSIALKKLNYGNNCEFWSYEQDPLFFNENELFYDVLHLNSKGVDLFTIKIAERLKTN